MGLIQRAVEKAGMATISVSLAKDITKNVLPPRAVLPGFPLGHPIGFPGNENQQLWVLRILLKYLQEINSPGSLVELDPTSWNDSVNI